MLGCTLLSPFTDKPEQLQDDTYMRRKDEAMHRAGECKSLLNTRWTRRRLGHRCKIDSDGKRCCSSRSACVYSITQLLVSLFLACLPPIPALNKWVANYPVLTWLVLGTMMHHILPRMWDLTVFKIPNIFQEGGVGGDDPDVEGEGIQSHQKKHVPNE